ncbi:MAG: SHOCT domain-containing protein [Anaerolineae bacterium]|nr:SHOCT domain-containing protein [Anaerolineae bacterium]
MRSLGCLLLIVSIVVMAVLVVLPVFGPFENNSFLMSVQTALHCPAGSRFEQEFANYSDFRGSARVATSYCVDAEGQRTRVPDENLIVIGLVGFLVPFLIGLFLLVGGISRSVSRRAASFASIGAAAGDDVIDVGGMKVRISQSPPIVVGSSKSSTRSGESAPASPDVSVSEDGVIDVGGMKVRISQSPPIIMGTSSTTSIPGGSLTDKLQELKDALDKGLITQDEYDQMRKEILDSRF